MCGGVKSARQQERKEGKEAVDNDEQAQRVTKTRGRLAEGPTKGISAKAKVKEKAKQRG